MSLGDNIRRLKQTVEANAAQEASKKEQGKHPSGWEPGVVWEGDKGTVTTRPLQSAPNPTDWSHILEIWGLDPEMFDVVPPVNFRAWDSNLGDGKVETLYYYRANITAKNSATLNLDIDDLLSRIENYDYHNLPQFAGEGAMVVCLADWQIGKGPEGTDVESGVEATVERILKMKADVLKRLEELRMLGRDITTLYVVGMGDMIEKCVGDYPGQEFVIELNERQQMRVTRKLLLECLVEWSQHVYRMIVGCVGGNHGANTTMGARNVTDDGDNLDVALFEPLAEAFALNPEKFSHVSFVIPEDKLYISLNIAGKNVTFAHGHKAKKGATAQQKQHNWWKDMSFQDNELHDTDILVTGHYHHFSCVEVARGKHHLQCPTLDCGSKWWEDLGGGTSLQGTLTFTIIDEKLQDIQVV